MNVMMSRMCFSLSSVAIITGALFPVMLYLYRQVTNSLVDAGKLQANVTATHVITGSSSEWSVYISIQHIIMLGISVSSSQKIQPRINHPMKQFKRSSNIMLPLVFVVFSVIGLLGQHGSLQLNGKFDEYGMLSFCVSMSRLDSFFRDDQHAILDTPCFEIFFDKKSAGLMYTIVVN